MNLAVCLCSIFCFTAWFSCGVEQKHVVHIAVLTENDSEDSSPIDAYTVGELALALINSSSILPDYQLQLIRGLGGCGDPPGLSPFLAAGVLGGTDQNPENPAIIGAIGPLCSTSAEYLGSLLRREELALIDIHLGVSARLESRSDYPNSFGVVGSSNLFFRSVLELIMLNNWSNVSIFYDDSQLYHAYTLKHSLPDNFTINEYFISSSLTYIPLDEFKLQSRITLLFMREDLVRKVLCTAYHADLVFPAYQFVIVLESPLSTVSNRLINFTTPTFRKYSCSADDLAVSMKGAIVISFEELGFNCSSAHSVHSYNFSFEEFVNVCRDEQLCFETTNPTFSYLFDAFWSLALALHNSHLKPVELSFSSSGLSEQSEMIKQELLRLDFNGFSGPIRFSESTGFVARNISLHQYVGGELMLLGTMTNEDTTLVLEQGEFLPWNIRTIDTVLYQDVPLVFTCIAFVLTAAVLLLLVALHILTVIYRNTAEVKANSYKMMHLMYAGCYLLSLSNIIHICLEGFRSEMTPTTTCYLFHVLHTLIAVSYTMIASTLCLRTWRLYRIFVFYKNPGRFLTDYPLMLTVLICVVVEVLIALTWVVADPLIPTIINVTEKLNILRSSNGSVEDVVLVQNATLRCLTQSSKSYYFWFVPMNTFSLILAIILAVLVYLTRKIPQEKFKTQSVLRLDYIITVFGLVVITMYSILLLITTPEAKLYRFILFAVGTNTQIIVVCILLYFPPLYPTLLKKSSR